MGNMLPLAVIIGLGVFAVLGCLLSLFVSRKQSPDIRPMWHVPPNIDYPPQVTPLGYYSAQQERRVYYTADELHKGKHG